MSASDDEFDEYIDELNDEVEAQKRQPKRYLRDLANPLEFYDDDDFRRRFRFGKQSVIDFLLPLVEDHLSKPNNRGLPVSPMHQLLLALRFFATASYQVFNVFNYIHFVCILLFMKYK